MTKKTIRTLDALLAEGFIKDEDLNELQPVVEEFSLAIPPLMQKLIDKNNPNDPIAYQFVPSIKELEVEPKELKDPIGDDVHSPVKGIIHRYPDRCLFTPVLVCPVYCRFCFRREKVGLGSESLSPEELENAFLYIQNNKNIWEVILTGGDPLILKPKILKNIISRLNAIPHVEIIRIHTRIPVVEPERITSELIAALKDKKPVYIMIHANHPTEFTQEATEVISHLSDAGIPLLSQTLLIKNVNDNIEVLSQLMRLFLKNRIKPYYLHHGDLARGTKHFRTTIATGRQLMRELRGRFSGMCQPTYVLDIPGGFGKVPIGPDYITEINEEEYCVQDYKGHKHSY